jgi:5-methylcytosine-specific restriction endonuclease McrA
MSGSITALVRVLVDGGASPQLILAAVEQAELAKDNALDRSREKARNRIKRYQERLNLRPSEWRDRCAAVKERDGYICGYCGDDIGPMHVDHIVPLIQGGSNDIENLITACRECNCGKGGRTPDQWMGDE